MKEIQQSIQAKNVRVNLYRIEKRLFDILVSSILILCCIPLFILISILIKISSGRPVLFKQTRTGKGFHEFTIYKFRSMKHLNQNSRRHNYEWDDGVPPHFMFKTDFDDSVTSIGRILRKYSLDELPQLFNVFKGNMSLVGPRPEIPEITKHYNQQQRKRLMVKPGMTGYAQIKGRATINHGKKIEYDLYYVKNQSFQLDIKVILLTAMQLFKGKGAF